MIEGFDIYVDGVPRTFRDEEAIALDAARYLKGRNPKSEIKVIHTSAKWLVIANAFDRAANWQIPPKH